MSVFGVILVRIFLHSDLIRSDIPYLSVFSPNARKCEPEKLQKGTFLRNDCLRILFLTLSVFKRINLLLFPPISFSDNFRGNRSSLIRLNLLNIRSEILRRSFTGLSKDLRLQEQSSLP